MDFLGSMGLESPPVSITINTTQRTKWDWGRGPQSCTGQACSFRNHLTSLWLLVGQQIFTTNTCMIQRLVCVGRWDLAGFCSLWDWETLKWVGYRANEENKLGIKIWNPKLERMTLGSQSFNWSVVLTCGSVFLPRLLAGLALTWLGSKMLFFIRAAQSRTGSSRNIITSLHTLSLVMEVLQAKSCSLQHYQLSIWKIMIASP